MQVIVTSYRRLKYLRRTLESLRQDAIELIVVDGGSDEETQKYIRETADHAVFLQDNPGADVLKNAGLRFVKEPEFIVSSDDLVYPKGYSKLIFDQYRALNRGALRWTFVACSLDNHGGEDTHHYAHEFTYYNGVRVREVGHSQVAGASLDTAVVKAQGGFPTRYGKTGLGDVALSVRLRRLGFKIGYFWDPVLEHIGASKADDYPEYTKEFRKEDDALWPLAARDQLR